MPRLLALLLLLAGTGRAQDESALKKVVATVRPAVVLVESDLADGHRRYGTGFLVSSDGLVATAEPVCRLAVHVACYYRNQQRIAARLVAVDEELELALLRLVTPGEYPTVSLADSTQQVAEGVAVGLCAYPPPARLLALGIGLDSQARYGTVSALLRGDTPANRERHAVLAVDLPAADGDVGAPLFRADNGRVVGLSLGARGGVSVAAPSNQITALAQRAGASLRPAPLRWGDPRCNLEPGLATTLKLLRDDGELSTSFIAPVDYDRQPAAATEALEYLVPAFGYLPAICAPPLVDGPRLYVAGLDERVRCLHQRRLGTSVDWEQQLDYPVVMRPALDGERLIVATGDLDPAGQARARSRQLVRTIASGVGYSGVVVPFAGAISSLIRLFGNMFYDEKPRRELHTFGRVYILRRADGGVERRLETAFPSQPAAGGGVAYLGSLGLLQAVRLSDGEPLWRVGNLEDKLDSRVWYQPALGGDGRLYTFEVPVFLAIENFESPARTYFLMAGRRHQEPGEGLENRALLRCRDPATGAVQWTAPLGRVYDYAHPLATDLLLDTAGGRAWCQLGPVVMAVDLRAGKLLWPEAAALDRSFETLARTEWERKQRQQEAGAVKPHLINGYLSGTSRGLLRAGERLYHGAHALETERAEATELRCLNAGTGELLGTVEAAGRVTGAAVRDGVLYYASGEPDLEPGRPPAWLHAVRESDRAPLWRLRLPAPGITDPPAVVGDTIYFCDQNGLFQVPRPR